MEMIWSQSLKLPLHHALEGLGESVGGAFRPASTRIALGEPAARVPIIIRLSFGVHLSLIVRCLDCPSDLVTLRSVTRFSKLVNDLASHFYTEAGSTFAFNVEIPKLVVGLSSLTIQIAQLVTSIDAGDPPDPYDLQ